MAEATLWQEGDNLDYTPSGAAVVSGEIVQIAGGAGVVCNDTADGELGAVMTKGVFKVAKSGSTGPVFAEGDQVDWDATNNLAVTTGGDFSLGVAVAAATDSDTYVVVKLNTFANPAADA